MGTHCALGVKMKNGSIIGCYVHYDGYEEHMMPTIRDYLRLNTTTALAILIARAQTTGGIRSFGKLNSETDFLEDPDPYVITSQNWKEDHYGTHAWYLVDHDTEDIEVRHAWVS